MPSQTLDDPLSARRARSIVVAVATAVFLGTSIGLAWFGPAGAPPEPA